MWEVFKGKEERWDFDRRAYFMDRIGGVWIEIMRTFGGGFLGRDSYWFVLSLKKRTGIGMDTIEQMLQPGRSIAEA